MQIKHTHKKCYALGLIFESEGFRNLEVAYCSNVQELKLYKKKK